MIDPKFLHKLGAFGVDSVPVFYPLHGQVLGVQDQSFCPCRPHCQLGVQISCCVECVPKLWHRTSRTNLLQLVTVSMASVLKPAVVGLVLIANKLQSACPSGCLVG